MIIIFGEIYFISNESQGLTANGYTQQYTERYLSIQASAGANTCMHHAALKRIKQ